MPVQPGKVTHFNGMVNEMHTTAYAPRDDCESHWTYGQITELPARAERTTLADLLRIARADLGPDALIELDQELITDLTCPNGHSDGKVLRPLSEVSFEAAHCPTCGEFRQPTLTHTISGEEDFLHRTLASVGVPPLHIVKAHNGVEYRFYELTGDLEDALHFQHFDSGTAKPTPPSTDRGRVRLKGSVESDPGNGMPPPRRVRLRG
jgi:hypothetical protein